VVDVNGQDPTPPTSDVIVQMADPSLTVTLPPGVPAPGGTAATLTATVYGWPTTVAALRSEVMVVALAATFTVCGVPAAVADDPKLPSVA
jgi:hypothetical protein